MKTKIIGISGPSGSGKSTIAAELAKLHNGKVISADRYFKNELPDMISPDNGKMYTDRNSPDSIDYTRLLSGVKRASNSKKYKTIIVEGLLIFYVREIRELFDCKIFVTAEPETCLYRRIIRNMSLFSQTPQSIGDYYLKCARHREAKFCLPTIKYADYIIDNDVAFTDSLDKINF
ncbi:MAG: AAA family ATPase [Clostridiales bacterium]|nr:AAA family ATPase [Clostridiales bacterium]